jgi:hypothetical protein
MGDTKERVEVIERDERKGEKEEENKKSVGGLVRRWGGF